MVEDAGGAPQPEGTEATVRRLVDLMSCDPVALTDGELAEALIAIDSLGSRIGARRSALVSRWDTSMIWAGDGARSAGAWLTARCEVSRGQAAWDVRQARALRHMPVVAAAFAEGRLGPAKVRSLVTAREQVEETFAAHEQWLVDQTENLTVEQAGYLLRRWRYTVLANAGQEDAAAIDAKAGLHLSQSFDGEWMLDATLDPESGAILKRAIDDEVDALFRRGDATLDDSLTPARRRLAALVELVRRGARTPAAAEADAGHGDAPAGGDGTSKATDASGASEPVPETPAAPDSPGCSDFGFDGPERSTETGRTRSTDPDDTTPVDDGTDVEDDVDDPAPRTEPSTALSPSGAGRPTVILQIDARTAGREPVTNSLDLGLRINDCDGTGPINYLTLDRMLCDADIIPVIIDGTGEILDIGRSRRYPSPAQRRALTLRDRGCVFPGCDININRCDAHHIVPWEWNGPTNLANLVLVCRYHHHCVHEGGFVLTRGIDHLVRVWRPDGTALPLGRHGTQLANNEPRPAPHPTQTGEPPDITKQRQALRQPPPPPPAAPPRFLEPTEHTRRRYLTDRRNCERQPAEQANLTISLLDIQRGNIHFPDQTAS